MDKWLIPNQNPAIFAEPDHDVTESVGEMHLKVMRSSGARGQVSISYKTIDGTAKSGRDFQSKSGELVFNNDEHEWVHFSVFVKHMTVVSVTAWTMLKGDNRLKGWLGGSIGPWTGMHGSILATPSPVSNYDIA